MKQRTIGFLISLIWNENCKWISYFLVQKSFYFTFLINLKFKILSFIQKHKITTFIEYRARITFFVIKFHCILFRCIWSFQSVLEILMGWTFKIFDFNKKDMSYWRLMFFEKSIFTFTQKLFFLFYVNTKKKRISQNILYLKCKIVISFQF